MPIYNMNSFWSYIDNESPFILQKVKEILTHKSYNFETKKNEYEVYWQEEYGPEIEGIQTKILRFPSGLIKYLVSKINLQVETAPSHFYKYSDEEILSVFKEAQKHNPDFEIRDYQIEMVKVPTTRFASLILSGVGSGKEQPCDIFIPTPEGFRLFGNLKVGDSVFGKDGKSQLVTGIFPQGIKDIYKVSFQNGATVECGLDHLWTVTYKRCSKKTLTLKEILKKYYNIDKRGFKEYLYEIEYTNPIEYSKKDYFIDPYILGILIGDGTLTTERIGFSCPDSEIEITNIIKSLLKTNYHLYNSFSNKYNYKVKPCSIYYISYNENRGREFKNEYKLEIRRLGLNVKSHLKFIPEEYLLGSVNQRKELLAGLLDSDGCCRKRSKTCSITYGTVSEKLAKDVQQLVFSLGGAATIRSYERKNRRKEYEVCIEVLFNPFKLLRKRNNYVPYRIHNTIINIEKIRRAEAMCIKVENEDELYITQNYIPTHNTSGMSLLIMLLKNNKILVMNGNNFILQQINDRLVSFGETDISWNPSKDPDYTKRIVLINTKLSDSKLNKQDPNYINFLSEVNTLIVDEAHRMQALTGFEPIFYMDPTKLQHIVGYSGSPYRNNSNIYLTAEDFRLTALLGETAFSYEMKDTVNQGTIAKPYAYFIKYNNRPGYVPEAMKDNYFMQYRANIIYNKNRNIAGIAMLKFLHENGIKTIASFNNIKPGQNIMKSLKEAGIPALFICGDETIYEWVYNKRGTLKLEKRSGTPNDLKKALLEDNYNIVIASQVLDEGVDIDIFQCAVLFSANKSNIGVLQRIGRASRKRKDGENISLVVDFKDVGGHYIFQNHYNERKKLMEESGITVFERVQDFINLVKRIGNGKGI